MLEPVQASCPVCGAGAVIYSCSPACCFNHVCAECRASWQMGTEPTATPIPAGLETAVPPDDSGDVHAPCARCGEAVFQVGDSDALYCARCRVMLRVRCTAVQPANA
jgi:hypothetical protein